MKPSHNYGDFKKRLADVASKMMGRENEDALKHSQIRLWIAKSKKKLLDSWKEIKESDYTKPTSENE
jgi:hypothetical protein